jgi:hypothetical protein
MVLTTSGISTVVTVDILVIGRRDLRSSFGSAICCHLTLAFRSIWDERRPSSASVELVHCHGDIIDGGDSDDSNSVRKASGSNYLSQQSFRLHVKSQLFVVKASCIVRASEFATAEL